jgi:hypothetical protein
MQSNCPDTVRATLNFSADRISGKVFSVTDPARTAQHILPVEVEIRNARTMKPKPTLEIEGFTIAAHPGERAIWKATSPLLRIAIHICMPYRAPASR